MSSFFDTKYFHAPFIFRNFEYFKRPLKSNISPFRCSDVQTLLLFSQSECLHLCQIGQNANNRGTMLESTSLLSHAFRQPREIYWNLEDTVMACNSRGLFQTWFSFIDARPFGTVPGIFVLKLQSVHVSF